MNFDFPKAILQTNADPKMTDRYRVISTKSVIDLMQDQGFNPVSYKVDKARKADPDYARHMVIFRPEVEVEINGVVPQFIWTNSHNGRTSGQLRAGFYRFVCTNGLIIGNDMMFDRVMHSKSMVDQVQSRFQTLIANVAESYKTIEQWNRFELDVDTRIRMAKEALHLRFGKAAGSYNPADLLVARRGEDEGYDLWTTFNRIQENSMKGGFSGRNATNRRVKARDVKGITQDISFNESLWRVAEDIFDVQSAALSTLGIA